MTGTADEKVALLREATREANMALKDLKGAIREGRELQQSLQTAAKVAVDEQLAPVVETGLMEFRRDLDVAISKSTEAVFARFDEITDMLMGETDRDRRAGKISVPELVAMKAVRDKLADLLDE